MNAIVLDMENKGEWQRYLEKLPGELQEVYFMPGYYEIYKKENVLPQCYIFTDGKDVLLYPYLKTELGGLNVKARGYYDIEGAYGYNGFVSSTSDEGFLSGFSKEFTSYCEKNCIIAEFTRFNPVLKNHNIAKHLDIRKVNENVIVDLTLSEEAIWKDSYEHSTRKNVNKAKRSGLSVKSVNGSEIDQSLIDEFTSIYSLTMERNSASSEYLFGKEYFRSLVRSIPDNSMFFFTYCGDKAVSCELVLTGKTSAYSFLGGTSEDYFELRTNNILKHEAIGALKKRGIMTFCLGGGTSPDDGIFKYKRTFSKNGARDFYIGSRVYNYEIYNSLCSEWSGKYPEKEAAYGRHLLKYKR
ncbi:MAG: GNAT family N-acetyltransferase [Candidatus Margulisiibacteriota bacterium]